jgi:hypothetical protein
LDLDRLNIANCRCEDTKLCSYLSWTDGLDIYHKMAIFYFVSLKLISAWFGIGDYKKVMIPFFILILGLTLYGTQIPVPKLQIKYAIISFLTVISLPTVFLLSIAYLMIFKRAKG